MGAGAGAGMIGVAISTHRRPHVLAQSLAGWAHAMPDLLVVTHDVTGEGVAATKNRGIAALMDAGVEHLFLADDDMWPTSPDALTRYADDPEPHLMHCWGKRRLIADDGHYTTWTHPRGVLLYAHRSVVEAVGGMRTEFGRWGGEHVDWSRRIHAAGLTRHRYADLSVATSGLWHCEDYTRRTPSTVTQAEREASRDHRHALYERYRDVVGFVPYR